MFTFLLLLAILAGLALAADAGGGDTGNDAGGGDTGDTATGGGTGGGGGNAENAMRRLLEKANRERDALLAEKAEREKAELSEKERLQRERDEALARATKAEMDALRARIAREAGLPAGAERRLQGGSEDELKADAAELALLMTPPAVAGQQTAPPAAAAGTITQPAAGQQPDIDEQIAAARKAGHHVKAIDLMRRKAGLPG